MLLQSNKLFSITQSVVGYSDAETYKNTRLEYTRDRLRLWTGGQRMVHQVRIDTIMCMCIYNDIISFILLYYYQATLYLIIL